MRLRRTLAFTVLFAACAVACRGDDLHDIQRACFERAFQHQGLNFQAFNFRWFEECIQEAFTADRFHFTITTVAPGAGIFAGGAGSGRVFRIKGFEFMGAATAAISTDGSPMAQAQMTFALPSPGFYLQQKMRGKEAQRARYDRYGLRTLGRKPEDDPVDAKLSVTLRFRTMAAREQDFYGIGPATTRAGLASYGLIQTETYAGINQPMTAWSTVGLDFSFLQPRVTSSISDAPQIRSLYTEATAPGLTVRDDYTRFEPYVTFRVPAQRSTFTSIRIGYAFYHALGDQRLSFERLSGISRTTIPLHVPNPSHNTPSNRTGFANFLCPTIRSAARCSMGDITLTAIVSAAYTSAGSQVPFFFDSSLGGTDMDGYDVLRGFGQYRFRGPSAVLFQVDYRHPLWGPVGLLSFYDMGKVVQERSDLSFAELRHDIGLGLYLHAGNRELARFYIGFGTGEPARPSFKFPNSF